MDGKETLGFSSINLRNLCTECFVLAQLGPWRVKGKSVIAGAAQINPHRFAVFGDFPLNMLVLWEMVIGANLN